MITRKILLIVLLSLPLASYLVSNPSYNEELPGCFGAKCHAIEDGIVSASPLNNIQVEVSVAGAREGDRIAGELLDMDGNVLDYIDNTHENPFILTAPKPGKYIVNAGFKNMGLRWDSAAVKLMKPKIQLPSSGLSSTRNRLYQNHPNPFNNETVLKFSLLNDTYVEFSIYNLQGQKVKTLANDHFSEGIHSLRWDGHDDQGNGSPSGVYFAVFTSDEYNTTMRITLAK